LVVLQGPGEFGEGIGADAGLFGEDGCRGRRRGETDDLAAVLGPGQGEGVHRGGLTGAGRRDRQLQACAGRAHLPDEGSRTVIECVAVRGQFQQGKINS
jgi:hypothetical protein